MEGWGHTHWCTAQGTHWNALHRERNALHRELYALHRERTGALHRGTLCTRNALERPAPTHAQTAAGYGAGGAVPGASRASLHSDVGGHAQSLHRRPVPAASSTRARVGLLHDDSHIGARADPPDPRRRPDTRAFTRPRPTSSSVLESRSRPCLRRLRWYWAAAEGERQVVAIG